MSVSSWTTFGVLLLSLLADRQCSGLQCYVGIGHKISNSSQLRTVDCATRDAVSDNMTSSPSDKVPTNCIIFYNPIANDAEFACDRDSVCTVARGTQTTSACYKKTRGSLRCCQGDLCNADSNLYHMSPPQSSTICYSGTNSQGSTNTVEVQCPTSWCYIELLRLHGRIINQTFGCDSQCDSSSSPPTVKSCSEKPVSTDGLELTQRRCICSTDRCNNKIDLILPEASTPSPSPSSTTDALHLSMHNPDHGIHSSRSMMRVVVPVGTGIIALLIVVLLAIVVVRYREHRAKSLTFTYTQLTADLAEDPPQNDDDRLLIP